MKKYAQKLSQFINNIIMNMLYNSLTEYKYILQTFTIQEQLREIESTINSLYTRKHRGNIKDNRYERIKELKHMKHLLLGKV